MKKKGRRARLPDNRPVVAGVKKPPGKRGRPRKTIATDPATIESFHHDSGRTDKSARFDSSRTAPEEIHKYPETRSKPPGGRCTCLISRSVIFNIILTMFYLLRWRESTLGGFHGGTGHD